MTGSRWTVVIAAQSRAVLAGTGGSGRSVPWLFLHGLSCSSAAALLVTARVNLRRQQLTQLNDELDLAANTDALTGLANRRLALSQLGHAISTGTCAVLLIDIDHFKGVNDSHAHAAGDGVLTCVAGALWSSLRSGDTLSRWGGDEFLAIMPATSLSAAEDIACRSLDRVRALSSTSSDIPRVSVSIGCAATVPSYSPSAIDELLLRADQALFRANAAGRSTGHTSVVWMPLQMMQRP